MKNVEPGVVDTVLSFLHDISIPMWLNITGGVVSFGGGCMKNLSAGGVGLGLAFLPEFLSFAYEVTPFSDVPLQESLSTYGRSFFIHLYAIGGLYAAGRVLRAIVEYRSR